MKKLATLTVASAALIFSLSSFGYHIFNTDNFTQIAAWDTSTFAIDNLTVLLPDGTTPAATPTALAVPNNDEFGLLFLVDMTTVHRWTISAGPTPVADGATYNCNEGGSIYDRPPATNIPFRGAYDGLARWDTASVSTTAVNMQFVCNTAELDEADVISGANFLCNTYNEIIYDEDGSVFSALGIDAVDLDSVLGIGIGLDSNCDIAFSGGINPITEAFIVMNEDATTPLDDGNLLPTMVHEIGHTLGLGHTPSIHMSMFLTSGTLNGGDDPDVTAIPTMYPFSPPSAFGPDDGDSLELDDIGAITKNYPGTINPASFCTITGQVLDNSGNPIDGAAVIAYDTANPANEISTIVGGNPSLSDGNYAIEFVPNGDYLVTLIPLDGSAIAGGVDAWGNIDDVFPTEAAIFSQRFYNSSTSEGGATVVTCTGGTTAADIDFLNIFTNNSGIISGGGGPGIVGDDDGCQAGAGGSVLSALWLALPAFWLGWLRNRKRR